MTSCRSSLSVACAMVLSIVAACHDALPPTLAVDRQPVPGPVPGPVPVPPVTVRDTFPTLTRSDAIVYALSTARSIPLDSRYVLYGDSTFALQYTRIGEYTGRYSRTDSLVSLVFNANAGRWYATALLRDDCLVVRYNIDMALSDFEDGDYCRAAAK